MKRLWSLGYLLLGAVSAGAEPPHDPVGIIDRATPVNREPTKGLALGTFRIEFERTTLAEVTHAASSGTIAQRGDAAEHILWLCYTVKRPSAKERLWIISSGEMGGSDHAVTEISAQFVDASTSTVDCPYLPAEMQPHLLGIPVWLGSADSDLQTALVPSEPVRAWRSYRFVTDVGGDCTEMNWIGTKSAHGHIISIRAGQITSC